jgi:ubiquinone/menaquinone biosynthesis C-methylase UbiE
MKQTTLDLLACPKCHGRLIYSSPPGAASEPQGEALAGSLLCPACQQSFPIENGIPRFVRMEELDGQNLKFARFYDWFSVFYAPGARLTYKWFGERGRQRILKHLEPLQGRLLETSIGSGPNLPYFVNHPGVSEMHGMDISAGQLAQCQRYAQKRGWQVELTQANAEELPYQDNSFDALFHFGGINFFDNRQQAVDEMIRVVKPGGKVVFSDEGEKVAKVYEKLWPKFKGWFQGRRETVRAPIDLVPAEMQEIRLEWILGEHIYIIEFRKPDIINA